MLIVTYQYLIHFQKIRTFRDLIFKVFFENFIPANICWSRRRLEDVFSLTIFCLLGRLQDVLRIRLQNVFSFHSIIQIITGSIIWKPKFIRSFIPWKVPFEVCPEKCPREPITLRKFSPYENAPRKIAPGKSPLRKMSPAIIVPRKILPPPP